MVCNRGSRVVSRLANLYPDRFVGFGFLALGYLPPAPEMSFEDMSRQIKAALGRETFGYMPWFAADGTADVLKQNVSILNTRMLLCLMDDGDILTMTIRLV